MAAQVFGILFSCLHLGRSFERALIRPRHSSYIRSKSLSKQSTLRATGGGLSAFDEFASTARLLGALDKLSKQNNRDPQKSRWEAQDSAWLLVPPLSPWLVIHFIGGAGFGTFPQISYKAFLEKIVELCGGGVAVICCPYYLDVDHGSIAAEASALFDAVLRQRCEDGGWAPQRVVRLGHSLGAKMHVVNTARDRSSTLGLIAFNNFGIRQSASQAAEMVGKSFIPSSRGLDENSKSVMGFISELVQASGLEFKPSPDQTRAMAASLGATCFVFSGDSLDCSADLPRATTVTLSGNHNTPVFIRYAAEDVASNPATRDLVGAFVDEKGAVSFGDEVAMTALAEAVAQWLLPSTTARIGPARST
jgi:hypothetical protein